MDGKHISNTHSNKSFTNLFKLAFAALAVLVMVNLSAVSANAATTKNIDVTTKGSQVDTLAENTANIYRFSLNRSGRVEFKVVTEDTGIGYVWFSAGEYDKFSTENIFRYQEGMSNGILMKTYTLDLTKGDYYFMIEPSGHSNGSYTISWNYTDANESFQDDEGGSNEFFSTANTISLNQEYICQLAANDASDTFKFEVPSTGTVVIKYTADKAIDYMKDYLFADYDLSSHLYKDYYYFNNNLGKSYTHVLTKGIYYLKFERDSSYYHSGPIKFSVSYTSAKETFDEEGTGENNSIQDADAIKLNTSKDYIAAIGINDTCDYFKFTVEKAGQIVVSAKTDGQEHQYKIFGPDDFEKRLEYGCSFGKDNAANNKYEVTPGTYVIAFNKYHQEDGHAVINFKIGFHAHSYTVEKAVTPAYEGSESWYDGTLGYFCSVCGKEKGVSYRKTLYAVKTIKLSATKSTYNGKVFKPTVVVKDRTGKTVPSSRYKVTYSSGCKNAGKYKVSIKFDKNFYTIGSNNVKTLYFEIDPKATKLKSVTSPSKGTVKVAFEKQTNQMDGYEVQISYYKKFSDYDTYTVSKKDTSKTIKKLRKGTLYVRVRTYKKVSGGKIYSAWSATKSVKVK